MAAEDTRRPEQDGQEEEEAPSYKRDEMRAIEKEMQEDWAKSKLYELDAPATDGDPKFMVTFPYPYMNGRLHLGHTFTVSKAEFGVRYQRLKGKNALFPFGFHCTGMPIKACADKLVRELEQFGPQGPPPPPPKEKKPEEAAPQAAAPAKKGGGGGGKKGGKQGAGKQGSDSQSAAAAPAEPPKEEKKKSADPTQYHSQKSKVKAKTGGEAYQWNIMRSIGIPDSEIPKFAKAEYWLEYFPPRCQSDLQLLGSHIDWRRSFITTDKNPYYDSFVRWQFVHLKAQERVRFGSRYTIFSPKDNQPCADHDRASGEGVLPQDYTLIKLRVVSNYPASLAPLIEGTAASPNKRNVFLVAATLRPETMYGQTNCWILPDGDYGAYEAGSAHGDEVYICTERSARNLSFQGFSPSFGKPTCLVSLKGSELLGTKVEAPQSSNPHVYVLPLPTISTEKGTGVVTSVPSDSPDDFIMLNDLKTKPQLRDQYHVDEKWVVPYDVIPIIQIPGIGNTAAPTVCAELNIKSHKEKVLLEKAKDVVYKRGFNDGVMAVGPHAGRRVAEAKPIIRDEMIAAGTALPYSEPADKVISRSGDECVVCLTDQWYMNYIDEDWKVLVRRAMANINTHGDETRHMLTNAVEEMKQWACSRTYGLGTQLPWAPQYLIESLSDSTIYMAYYTVAHILHGDVYGQTPGNGGIKPEQMRPEVWDYVFALKGKGDADAVSTASGIPVATLNAMRREFEYWYPLDLRVSGKDLVPNHLSFWLYNHVAMFPESRWPRGVRINGHMMLNNAKMSKSTGNFMTLTEGVERFSADGMRIGLAEAGDSIDDANFTEKTANRALLRLHSLIGWAREMVGQSAKLRQPGAENVPALYSFADRLFEVAINRAIIDCDAAYTATSYRMSLKAGFFEMFIARDAYRQLLDGNDMLMRADLVRRFIEVVAQVMAPITPHTSDYLWRRVLGHEKSVMVSGWPTPSAVGVDESALRQNSYFQDLLYNLRSKLKLAEKSKKPITGVSIYVAATYPDWQQTVLKTLQRLYCRGAASPFPSMNDISTELKTTGIDLKKTGAMKFATEIVTAVTKSGEDAMALEMSFDERQTIQVFSDFILKKVTNNVPVTVMTSTDPLVPKEHQEKTKLAVPGKPAIVVA